MKKIRWLIIFAFIFAAGAYLYLSHAYIYRKIDQAKLKSPDKNQIFIISANMDDAKTGEDLTYAALGDSLTAGVGVNNYKEAYPYLIAGRLALGGSRVVLKDRSIPGAKTGDLSALVAQAIADRPDVITLLVGVNDVHGKISLAEFKNNYGVILKRLTKETEAKIYLVNIPFIGAPNLILPPYNYYFDWKTKRFNAVIKALAETYQLGYIDLYSETEAQFKKSGAHYSPDLFHPSAEGYALWAEIIYGNINK